MYKKKQTTSVFLPSSSMRGCHACKLNQTLYPGLLRLHFYTNATTMNVFSARHFSWTRKCRFNSQVSVLRSGRQPHGDTPLYHARRFVSNGYVHSSTSCGHFFVFLVSCLDCIANKCLSECIHEEPCCCRHFVLFYRVSDGILQSYFVSGKRQDAATLDCSCCFAFPEMV